MAVVMSRLSVCPRIAAIALAFRKGAPAISLVVFEFYLPETFIDEHCVSNGERVSGVMEKAC